MATEILNNCNFDATRIVKLYLATQVSTGGTINFPVNYHTLSGTSDSIIKYESWDATNIVQIGQQLIQFNEVLWVDENISFNEELIIDQRGRNYVKTLTFELSGIDQTLVDQLEALGLDYEGMLCPPKTLAILIDENENELIAGYDFPFRLESITTGINGDQNSITLTYISNSHSRARNAGFPTPSPSPTPTISVSSSITPSVSVSPFLTPTPSISVSQFLTPTPSITPSCIRPTDKYKELYLYYSGATGNFTGSLSEACNALQYWAQTGFHIEIYEKHNVLIFNENPDFIRDSCSGFYEDTFVYSGHNTTDCILMDEGYYIYRCSIFSMGETYYFGYIFHIDSNGILDNYNAQTQCPQPTPSISVTPSVTSTPSIVSSPSVSISNTPSLSISNTPSNTPSISLSITPSPTPTMSITPSTSVSKTPSISITPTPSISISITPSPTPSS